MQNPKSVSQAKKEEVEDGKFFYLTVEPCFSYILRLSQKSEEVVSILLGYYVFSLKKAIFYL